MMFDLGCLTSPQQLCYVATVTLELTASFPGPTLCIEGWKAGQSGNPAKKFKCCNLVSQPKPLFVELPFVLP